MCLSRFDVPMRRASATVLTILILGACSSQLPGGSLPTGSGTPQMVAPPPEPEPVAPPPPPPPTTPEAVTTTLPPSQPHKPPMSLDKATTLGDSVIFAVDGAALSGDARTRLKALAAELQDVRLESVNVTGYASGRRRSDTIELLSLQRALAVKDYLVSHGVEAERIKAGGGALSSNTESGTGRGGAAQNRVDIIVVGDDTQPVAKVWKPKNAVDVLYATDRKSLGGTTLNYRYANVFVDQPDTATLEHGVATVIVPPQRRRGTVKTDNLIVKSVHRSWDSGMMRWLARKLDQTDPRTMFSFESITPLAYADFRARLNANMNASASKTAILYIHGFNNDFRDAAFRSAQIAYDLAMPGFDVTPLMFSWPSDPGVSGLHYTTAQKNTEQAAVDLVKFLDEIATTTEIETVHLVAHSMGSLVLVKAMQKMARRDHVDVAAVLPSNKFRHIVFAAADVPPSLFIQVLTPALTHQHAVTSYVTNKDRVLLLSEVKNGWNYEQKSAYLAPRVGNNLKPGLLVDCVDTVDVGEFVSGEAMHSTWAESPKIIDDLRAILQDDDDPGLRGWKPYSASKRTIWRVGGIAKTRPPGSAVLAECRKG